MFGLATLDVMIGLVTVYLVFGMACTAIVEAVATWLSLRSKNLETAMNEFLAGDLAGAKTFVQAFYSHPLVQALSKGKDGRPSYIPAEIVGQVVVSLLGATGASTLEAAVSSLPGSVDSNRIKGLLDTLVKEVGGDSNAFRQAVEVHFDTTMERAAGWFKRYAQTVALLAAATLVLCANLDTVELAKALALNPAARLELVQIAEQSVKQARGELEAAAANGVSALEQARKQNEVAKESLDRALSTLQAGGLQFGWATLPAKGGDYPAKIAGLLISIFAVSLGAPFWFDVLQRFMQVRAAGTSPKEAAIERKQT